jgi:hypothetical protein
MAAGFGSLLGLTAPPPAQPKLGTEQRAYRQTSQDRSGRLRAERVSAHTINAAFASATNGQMRQLADLIDLMLANPTNGGVVGQRISGAVRFILEALSPHGTKLTDGSVLRAQLKPVDSANLAKPAQDLAALIVAETKEAMQDQDAPIGSLAEHAIRSRLGFGGLTEIGWKVGAGQGTTGADAEGQGDAGTAPKRWTWNDWLNVPGQRMRFDVSTGEPGFAERPYDYTGKPIASYDRGTWIPWTPDVSTLDPGLRGVLPDLIEDWFHVSPVGRWWASGVERFNQPAVDVATDEPLVRAAAEEAAEDLGSQASYIHGTKTTVNYLQAPGAAAKGSPCDAFEQSRARRVAVAVLGAEQSVSVSEGQGSQQSVAAQMKVREDWLLGDLDFFLAGFRRYAITAMAVMNHGLQALDLIPTFELIRQEQVDVLKRVAEIVTAEDAGFDMTVPSAYSYLGWSEPESGVETLRQRRARLAGIQNGTVAEFPQQQKSA